MIKTVGELKEYIKNLPDNMPLVVEDVNSYIFPIPQIILAAPTIKNNEVAYYQFDPNAVINHEILVLSSEERYMKHNG